MLSVRSSVFVSLLMLLSIITTVEPAITRVQYTGWNNYYFSNALQDWEPLYWPTTFFYSAPGPNAYINANNSIVVRHAGNYSIHASVMILNTPAGPWLQAILMVDGSLAANGTWAVQVPTMATVDAFISLPANSNVQIALMNYFTAPIPLVPVSGQAGQRTLQIECLSC